MNLGNALDALLGPARRDEFAGLVEAAVDEGEAAYAAAGVDVVSVADDRRRRGDVFRVRPIGEGRRGGGSTFQSMHRGLPVETDYLTGEIVLLGRLHGVPTPVNAALQALVAESVAGGVTPGTMTVAELRSRLP